MHTHIRTCSVPTPTVPLPCVDIMDVVPAPILTVAALPPPYIIDVLPSPILTVAALPPPLHPASLYSEAISGMPWLQPGATVPVTPTFSATPVGSSTYTPTVLWRRAWQLGEHNESGRQSRPECAGAAIRPVSLSACAFGGRGRGASRVQAGTSIRHSTPSEHSCDNSRPFIGEPMPRFSTLTAYAHSMVAD